MKILFSLVSILTAVSAQAAELTWETDQTDPVELTEDTTITVPAGKTVTCSGVISGAGKLIKAGEGWLILSAANTYTGGTQIDGGKLQADNAQAFGPVNAELPIQVNADLNSDSISVSKDNSIALVVTVTSFAYPINCSTWTNHGKRPKANNGGRGSGTLYNIAYWNKNSKGTFSGKITGGDVSFHVGGFNAWAGNSDSGKALTLTGEIDCPGGTVAVNSRASTYDFKGKITAGAVYAPNSDDWPTPAQFEHEDNEIGLIDVGRHNSGGGFTAYKNNAYGGAILVSTTADFKDATDKQCSANFSCQSFDQTIDRPQRYHKKSLSAAFKTAAHQISMSDGKTLTMKASASDENDWIFTGTLNVVYDPLDDYTLLNVSRKHTMKGTIAVNRGCFGMDENCSFSNVTAVTVADGAVFSNACAFAGSLYAAQTVALGANAHMYMEENPFKTVVVELGEGAKLHVPEGVTIVATSLKYGTKYAKVGDHTGDAFLVGGGKVTVLTNPGAVEETVVWQGGSGTGFNTAANWVDKETVPDFEEGLTTLRFAAQGTENLTATADVNANVKGVEFGDVASFAVEGDGTHALTIGTDGVTAEDRDARLSAEIAAPVVPLTDQAWDFGSNVLFTMSGPLMANAQGTTPTVTITIEQGNPIWFVGSDLDEATSASTFAGTLSFKWKYVDVTASATWSPQVFATGYEPFGAATTVSIWGAPQSAQASTAQAYRQSCLWLSNAVVSANLESPYDAKQSRYGWNFCSCANSTNVVNGRVYNVRDIIIKSGSKLVFNGDVTIPAAFNSSLAPGFSGASGSPLVFNGRLIYPGSADVPGGIEFPGNAVCYFNAPSNDLRSAQSRSLVYWHFGADYAFCDGKTAIGFTSNTYADYDLHGHPQFVGSILDNSGAQESYRTRGLVKSTDAPTFIKINQTKNAVFYGTFDASITNLTLCGTATLTLKTANAIKGDLTLEGATLALDGGSINPDKNITFAGGTLSLSADASVYKAYYVEGGEIKPVQKGYYKAGDGSVIGGMLGGTGTLRVRKSDIKLGLMLFIR